MPTVSGLHAVLQKLLDNPPPATAAATLATWTEMKGKLPPLPSRQVNGETAYIQCEDCVRDVNPPSGKVNCTAWKCSCQEVTDMYLLRPIHTESSHAQIQTYFRGRGFHIHCPEQVRQPCGHRLRLRAERGSKPATTT